MDPVAGLFDTEFLEHMKKVSGELVRYTPEHFKTIHCTVRPEGSNDRLSFRIFCPQYPDEGTDTVNDGVRNAMRQLVAHWSGGTRPFPGMRITVEIQPDGSARNNFALLPEAGASEAASEPPDRPSSVRRPEPKPWWVEVGLWGINSRELAWVFVGISVLLAVLPVIFAFVVGDKRLFIGGFFILAAVWYLLCIQWMDEHGGWK